MSHFRFSGKKINNFSWNVLNWVGLVHMNKVSFEVPMVTSQSDIAFGSMNRCPPHI